MELPRPPTTSTLLYDISLTTLAVWLAAAETTEIGYATMVELIECVATDRMPRLERGDATSVTSSPQVASRIIAMLLATHQRVSTLGEPFPPPLTRCLDALHYFILSKNKGDEE
jgi:hypothetical protein